MFPSESLYVTLEPSRRYALLLAGAHGLALAALLLGPAWGPWLKLALGMAVALSCWQAVTRQALLTSGDAVVRLTWAGKEYYLTTAGGELVRARLAQRVVFRWLLALYFRDAARGWLGAKGYPVVILPGMVPDAAMRRLQVFFRWRAQPH